MKTSSQYLIQCSQPMTKVTDKHTFKWKITSKK